MNEFLRLLRNQWDRVAAGVGVIVGLGALFAGWNGMSNALYPAEQFPYVISGGILGLFLLGIGATLWVSADLRDEWRKLDELTRLAADLGSSSAPAEPTLGSSAAAEADLDAGPALRVKGAR